MLFYYNLSMNIQNLSETIYFVISLKLLTRNNNNVTILPAGIRYKNNNLPLYRI